MRSTMTSLYWIAAVIAINLFFCAQASAGRRVALVIGNSAYRHAATLANPANDARDMADVLRKRGFEVIEGIELDKAEFERKVIEFSAALTNAEMGLFFYSGHGLQVAGQNYLVPIDAKLSSVTSLDFEMVRFDVVQRAMERATQTNVMFLDACRTNPFERNLTKALGTRPLEIGRGLAGAESGIGTLISFATAPGTVARDGTGRNSPYTKALVRQIAASSEDLNALLIKVRLDVLQETQRQQVTWESSNLTGQVFFDSRRVPAQPAAPPPERVWKFNPNATPPAVKPSDGKWQFKLDEPASRPAAAATPPATKPQQRKWIFCMSSTRDACEKVPGCGWVEPTNGKAANCVNR